MFKTSSPSPARAIEFVRRNIVKMATEADWLKLKLPDLKAALLGAGGDASGLRSKQSYAEALVALGVALPGGGGRSCWVAERVVVVWGLLMFAVRKNSWRDVSRMLSWRRV